MTETQKEIIEIIEPFMDKTLSEGCIVMRYSGYLKCLGKFWNKYGDNVLHFVGGKELFELKDGDNKSDFSKILGHYDITAVLKYINSIKTLREINWETREIGEVSKYDIKFSKDFNYIEIWEDRRLFAKIPNKPLHLYIEEENKNLLELLKQL